MRLPKFLVIGRPESSALIGILFALGWSPCIGPILGTILLFASTSATALGGAFLLAVFSLGLGVPFLLCAAFIGRISSMVSKWARVSLVLSRVGAIVMLALGVLMITGTMGFLVSWGFSVFDFFGYERLLNFL
jgi:cytochrome c-type biogenesis protein